MKNHYIDMTDVGKTNNTKYSVSGSIETLNWEKYIAVVVLSQSDWIQLNHASLTSGTELSENVHK